MLKKRMLLLVAAMAAFGAIMVSAAVANPTGTAVTPGPSGTVNSAEVTGGGVGLVDAFTGTILADDVAHKVQTIQVGGSFNYAVVRLTALSPSQPGGNANCSSAVYSIGEWGVTLPWSVVPGATNVASLMLTLGGASNNGCVANGSVVTATFTAN